MDITKTLYVTHRAAWRAWLQDHNQSEPEIWLVYPRKETGRARIPYNDAVEEALCFGWIDSIVKTLDEAHTAQRFTPRNLKSGFSQTNKERLSRMIDQGKVLPEVLAGLGDVRPESFVFPVDILASLHANPKAWENFQQYSESYQRIRIAYIDHARDRPEEFEKRLAHFIKMTAQDRQFGFGIQDYY